MDYKSIVVEVDGDPGCRDRLRVAAMLAFVFGAHLTGITTTGFALGRVRGVEDPARCDMLTLERRRAQAHVHATLMRDMVAETGHTVSWSHEMIEDDPARALSRQGCMADVLLLAQRAPWRGVPPIVADAVETILLNCGRPVIVMPPSATRLTGGHAMIAWNDSTEAARAVADALPLLARASRVTVAATGDISGMADLFDYLRCHGIDASPYRLVPESDPAEALLRAVRASAAGMLIAGCYGRARVRELMFGGTTRSLLQQVAVPLLMSH
ncbi:universal stress protein [Cupriavidus plantarum]|uniref:universal stress protein n=1 Tax=Cupriavidus plantarum TaxID=942865 RepID=UPI000EB03076|nr:universal stress protein [Cupriavidus plantarum]RLK45649.1 nucleotide-binding universal stress UspA family protein [Cupriavidus plantarum]